MNKHGRHLVGGSALKEILEELLQREGKLLGSESGIHVKEGLALENELVMDKFKKLCFIIPNLTINSLFKILMTTMNATIVAYG